MSKFKVIRLCEIAEVVAGQSPKSKYYNFTEGTPFLQGNRTFGHLYPSIDTYTSKVTKIASKNSVLMSVRAPVGDLNIANQDICIGRGLASLDALDGDNKFLYYLLKANLGNLLKNGTGTTYDSISTSDLKNIQLIIPNGHRKDISEILSALDDQIELNNKINQELEDLAQTLYNYWFVQFEFPNEEGKPYKSSGGKMVWNEELKREIPEGWEVKNILDISETVWGNCPPGENILPLDTDDENAIPYCSGAGDMSGNIIVSPKAMTNNSKRMVKENTVLVSVAGTIGKTCLSDKKISIGRATLGISALDETHYGFIYFLIKSFCNRFNTIAIGAIQKIINSNHLTEINFAFNENLNCYKKINELLEAIILNEKQNQELAQLRDYLLPLLMNGQVTVSDSNPE